MRKNIRGRQGAGVSSQHRWITTHIDQQGRRTWHGKKNGDFGIFVMLHARYHNLVGMFICLALHTAKWTEGIEYCRVWQAFLQNYNLLLQGYFLTICFVLFEGDISLSFSCWLLYTSRTQHETFQWPPRLWSLWVSHRTHLYCTMGKTGGKAIASK